ncbi:MAG: FG-GAP repeat protein [Planctomycetota bacterium]
MNRFQHTLLSQARSAALVGALVTLSFGSATAAPGGDGTSATIQPGLRVELNEDFGLSLPFANGERFALQAMGLERSGASCTMQAATEWVQDFAPGQAAHGYVLEETPRASGELLRLRVASTSCDFASPQPFGDGLAFERLSTGGVLTYTGLYVYDATGRVLSSHFEVEENGFAIVIDDEEAVLPIVVDPLLAYQEAQILASDAELDDLFGHSVDLDGDTLVVGAPQTDDLCVLDPFCDSGGVYVYTRTAGAWTQQGPKIIDTVNGAAGDDFGFSVAVDGDTMVIGAPGHTGAGSNSGAFYVYTRTAGVWSLETGPITPVGAAAEDQVGSTVAVDGDTLVVGGRFHDATVAEGGAAWVYTRAATVWTEIQKLEGSATAFFDQFGSSVAVEDDRIVVGAPNHDAPMSDAGTAYVFEPAGLFWSEVAQISASDGSGSDRFGASVSIDGDYIAVGARFGDRSTTDPGAVYVYERSGAGVWAQEAKLLASDLSGGDRFGVSVDIEGTRLAIGAHFDNQEGIRSGSAYVFDRTGPATWEQQTKLVALDAMPGNEFGSSVSVSGDTVTVGSPLFDGGAGADQGAVYAWVLKTPTYDSFCYGDGGDQLGCTDCACGNNVAIGLFTGCRNSEGRGAQLEAFGVASVASDTLRFEMVGGTSSSFGLLISTASQLPIVGSCPAGSGIAQPTLLDGLRCGGGGLLRLGTRASNANGDIGITSAGWGPPNGPPGGLIALGGFLATTTRYFQVLYREDMGANCGTGVATSNGVTVTFVP